MFPAFFERILLTDLSEFRAQCFLGAHSHTALSTPGTPSSSFTKESCVIEGTSPARSTTTWGRKGSNIAAKYQLHGSEAVKHQVLRSPNCSHTIQLLIPKHDGHCSQPFFNLALRGVDGHSSSSSSSSSNSSPSSATLEYPRPWYQRKAPWL